MLNPYIRLGISAFHSDISCNSLSSFNDQRKNPTSKLTRQWQDRNPLAKPKVYRRTCKKSVLWIGISHQKVTKHPTQTQLREAPQHKYVILQTKSRYRTNLALQLNEQEDFDAFYLRQVVAGFAEDIEKLRKASDFKESSVPVLIQALKQGAGNFSEREKARVIGEKRS